MKRCPTPAALDAELERIAWDVWSYVRENRHSLDSERGCKMVRRGIDKATATAMAMLVKARKQNESLRAQLKAATKPQKQEQPCKT